MCHTGIILFFSAFLLYHIRARILYYIVLYWIALRCIILYYIILNYIILYYIILYYIILYYISHGTTVVYAVRR